MFEVRKAEDIASETYRPTNDSHRSFGAVSGAHPSWASAAEGRRCGPQASDGRAGSGNITRMKRAVSSDPGSSVKGKGVPKDVDEYLAGVPEPARGTLQAVRAAIRSAVPPGATEVISYRIPTFKYKGALVAFAAFSKHCSFFPMSYAVVELFKDELQDLLSSKGTIRFPVDKPLPSVLVKKLVKARIAQKDEKV